MSALIASIIGIVVFTLPVWIAAKVAQAEHPTFLHSLLSLIVGAILSVIGLTLFGGVGFLFIPIAYLLSFKFVLGISFMGAVVLAVLAMAGYYAMSHMMIGGMLAMHPEIAQHASTS